MTRSIWELRKKRNPVASSFFFFVFRRTVCVSITTQSTAGSLYNAHQTANSTVCLHARLHFEHGRIYTEEGRKKQKIFLWGVMLLIRKKKKGWTNKQNLKRKPQNALAHIQRLVLNTFTKLGEHSVVYSGSPYKTWPLPLIMMADMLVFIWKDLFLDYIHTLSIYHTHVRILDDYINNRHTIYWWAAT